MHSEHDIFNRLKRGDKEALKMFYLEQKDACLAFLAKNIGLDHNTRLDIYQDSVLALYQNILQQKLTELSSSLSTYLFAIAKNQGRKRLSQNLKVVETPDGDFANISDDGYSPEDDERMHKAMEAYRNMGEPCKSILEMYYFLKLKMDEIAARLNYQSPDVAKTQKSRCIKMLRKQIVKA